MSDINTTRPAGKLKPPLTRLAHWEYSWYKLTEALFSITETRAVTSSHSSRIIFSREKGIFFVKITLTLILTLTPTLTLTLTRTQTLFGTEWVVFSFFENISVSLYHALIAFGIGQIKSCLLSWAQPTLFKTADSKVFYLFLKKKPT